MRDLTDVRAWFLSGITAVDLATLAVSFVVAELLYKFHSFTVEAAAFLATWYVLRLVGRSLAGVDRR